MFRFLFSVPFCFLFLSPSALSDALREKYVKQLTGYPEILSPVLGEDVVPAYLYFAGDNAFLRVV